MEEREGKQRSNSTQGHKKYQNFTEPNININQVDIQNKQKQKQDEINSRTSTSNKRQKITLGVCAMKKKVQSKPMKQILSRLACKEIQILEMWQYLTQPFQQWPKVQALICFHSDGFPFVQAWRYVKKHKPFLINNLDKQQLLWDRTAVYDILKKIRVPVAKHYMIFKDKNYIDQIQMRGNGVMWGDQQDDNLISSIPLNMKKTTTANSQTRTNGQHRLSSNNNYNSKDSNASLKQINNVNINGTSNLINIKDSKQTSFQQIPDSKQWKQFQQKKSKRQINEGNESKNFNFKFNDQKQKDEIYIQGYKNYRTSIIDRDQNQQENEKKSESRNHSTSTQREIKEKKIRSNSLLMQDNNFTNEVQVRKSIDEKSVSKVSKNGLIFRKRSEVQIIDPPNRFPNALRSFHQKRLQNIDEFTVQQIDDGLIIRSSKTDKVHKLKKPFVQKPFDSQNHNICIYYPQNMGGGRKMLFRKIKDSCSQYQPNQHNIRTDKNYIYEQYLPTNAFDIKVYTIGPYYMYAQARRSPTLDGVVQRDKLGKQKRFPVILTPEEKFLCSKIVQQFQQQVCGFDLLRAQGKSYVCDVNGWSFVKGNPKYWDDCAIILRRKIFKRFFPHLFNSQSSKYQRFSNDLKNQYRPPMNRLNGKKQQLRSIVSIFRHGDRSPKLKMKLKTSDKRFLEFFKSTKKDQIKLKDAKSLTKILHITNQIIVEIVDINNPQFKNYSQMKSVLETGGRFQGFNRKIQMKVLQRQTQIDEEGIYPVKKILIVLKWGGQLSYFGYDDAVDLGKKIRQQRYDDDDDQFLNLYSSYKHDLKTYSSDQGRCIKTAAAFLKGFLNISGQLAPIITSMVNFTKKAQSLLDCTSQQNHSQLSECIKNHLEKMMNSQQLLLDSFLKVVKQNQVCGQMIKTIKQIGYPREKLYKMQSLIGELVKILQQLQCQNWHVSNESSLESHQQKQPQALIIIYKRWSKLQKDFYDKKEDKFNISKIPQIYDNIRYDMKKNHSIFKNLQFNTKQMIHLAKLLAYFVVPNQYGLNDSEKLATAKNTISPLLQKILVDLMFWKNKKYQDLYWKYKESAGQNDWKHIRTRLYFTSASHMYSILNIICLGNNRQLLNSSPSEQAQKAINQLYMSYLSHIEFRLYQKMSVEQHDPQRFRLQISISSEYRKDHNLKQFFLGGSQGFTIDKFQNFFQNILSQKKQQMQEKMQKMKDQEQFN